MPIIERQSVRIELGEEYNHNADPQEVFEETFWHAVTKIVGQGDTLEALLNGFFTVRFDKNSKGVIVATVAESQKRA